MKINLKIILFIYCCSCKSLKVPSEIYNQYDFEFPFTYYYNTLEINLKNSLYCPLRVWIYTSNNELQNRLNRQMPILLESNSDSTLIFSNVINFDNKLRYITLLGNPSKTIESIEFDFPFLQNKQYTVTQGNNTSFTHNTEWSRYALDLDFKTNDTIYSATSGYVVGVVNDYKYSGIEEKWKPFANFIRIYEPVSGVFCQYVHLAHNGSLVRVGDEIERGQKIGLSGNTGQSTDPHLHFCVQIPVNNEDGLKSIPFRFSNGQNSTDLKKGDKLVNYK